MSVTGEGEGGMAGRHKLKDKAHSREGGMGHVGLPAWRGRQRHAGEVGRHGEVGSGGLDSRRKFE
jgi:hypothetical protein